MSKASTLPRAGSIKSNFRSDLIAGFQVSLIALPLSIGISLASGFPAAGGILAAIIGGLIVSWLGGGRVSINGPAAGLIVVILFSVERLGQGDPVRGYPLTLAAIVCAGLIQIVLGLLRAGRLSVLFPETVVHGMLSAIGIIIALKQLPILLGTKAHSKELIGLIGEIPSIVMRANPIVTGLGLACLLVLVLWSQVKNTLTRIVPAPIIVVAMAIIFSKLLGIQAGRTLDVMGSTLSFGPELLVPIPDKFFAALGFPDFSQMLSLNFLSAVVAISLVASLETLLSATAVDRLDPLHRKTNLNRDLLAIGVGTTISGFLGGLPMIAEIVRSSANIAAGAKERTANFVHGAFLLTFALVLGPVVREIPLAALAALLIYTGYRLASPKELIKVSKIGLDQLIIYVATIGTILATDLLVGVMTGVVVKLLLHAIRGVSVKEFVKANVETSVKGNEYVLKVRSSLVFSNLAGIMGSVAAIPEKATIRVDLTECTLIDHTSLERLHHIKEEREGSGGELLIVESHFHRPVSSHVLSARRLRS